MKIVKKTESAWCRALLEEKLSLSMILLQKQALANYRLQ